MHRSQTYALSNRLKQRVKRAALGGEGNEAPFEEMFSQLAHSYLQDKAPSLMQYDQGFQVLERNEDDTKALGVTGFKVNGMQLYSPVFCINGEIKGHELLRLEDQNIWVPLKEPWLNEIFRRKPILIGDAVDKKNVNISAPDLSTLSEVPTKNASYKIAKSLIPFCRDVGQSSKRTLADMSFSLTNNINPLGHLKTASYRGVCRFYNILQNYPLIKHAFEQAHPGGFNAVRNEVVNRNTIRNSVASKMLPKFGAMKKKANVRFMSCSITMHSVPKDLTEKEKEQLLNRGYLVKDERSDNEVSKVTSGADSLDSIFNPQGAGIYDVMTSPGKFKKLVVIPQDYKESGSRYARNSHDVIVSELDGDRQQTIAIKKVWCKKKYPNKDYLKWVDSLPTELPRGDYSNYMALRGNERLNEDSCGKDVVRTAKGSALRSSANILYIPEDAHIFEWNHWCGDSDRLIHEVDAIDFMSRAYTVDKIKKAALRGYEPLKVVANSSECIINKSASMSLMDGLRTLITDYGLRERDATELLKQASLHHGYKVWIKRAELETPPIPEIPHADISKLTDMLSAAQSGEEYSSHDSSDIGTNPQVTVDNDYVSQDAQAIQKAIESGQKEIFDVSMLKSLYTVGDTDSIIEEHATKLTKAMTDAGDLLFRFYWKGDQFKEIYGPKSLPELESNLKKLFEILGDVVLFLKRNRLNKADYEQIEPLNLPDNSK